MENLKQGSALSINDVREELLKLLPQETQDAINSDHMKALIAKKDDGTAKVVVYHSQVFNSNIPGERETALQKLADGIHQVHQAYGLQGNLVVCSEIALHTTDLNLPKAIFSFPAIPIQSLADYNERFLKPNLACAAREGEFGK